MGSWSQSPGLSIWQRTAGAHGRFGSGDFLTVAPCSRAPGAPLAASACASWLSLPLAWCYVLSRPCPFTTESGWHPRSQKPTSCVSQSPPPRPSDLCSPGPGLVLVSPVLVFYVYTGSHGIYSLGPTFSTQPWVRGPPAWL